MINRIKLTENFWLDEFQCSCCHQVKIEPELLEKLQKLRTMVNFPFVLNSAFRCIAHNKKEGGKPKSFHLQGKAVDVLMKGKDIVAFAILAEEIGFKGIGSYRDNKGNPVFIHLDIGTSYVRKFKGEV